MTSSRTLLLFLDGVGLGPPDPAVNPFLRARLPVLSALLGGEPPHLGRLPEPSDSVALHPLDALLGVEGTPQSGTGQIALLTGRNAPRLFGRHFGPWPPVRLRPLLEDENLLRRVVSAGARALFANAYPRGYLGNRSSRRVAAPPLAARAAGLLTRDHEALARGEAVASEIVNDGWRSHLGFTGLPAVGPRDAGRTLARLAGEADLTLYAHYLTDLVGHRGGMADAVAALERVDTFLGGLLDAAPPDLLVLLASDHGNLEEVGRGHTRNPALGLALGPGAAELGSLRRITDVAPRILERVLGANGHHGNAP